MNQADAERRLEELEAKARHVDVRPLAEAAAERSGFSVDDILIEAERLHAAYGADPLAIECGIAQEQGVTVEQIRAEAQPVMGGAPT